MEKEKQIKYAKIVALISLVVLLIVLLIPPTEINREYRIRKEAINASGSGTNVEVVLNQKEPADKLEEISRRFRERHNTRNVFVFFYLTDTQNRPYAHAHHTSSGFEGVRILQPIYGELDWFVDALKIPNTEIMGVWADTLEVPYIIGIVRQGENTILKSAWLDQRVMFENQYLSLKREGNMDLFRNKNNPNEHESYGIIENGKLAVFDRFHYINNEMVGGELSDILLPLNFKKSR